MNVIQDPSSFARMDTQLPSRSVMNKISQHDLLPIPFGDPAVFGVIRTALVGNPRDAPHIDC